MELMVTFEESCGGCDGLGAIAIEGRFGVGQRGDPARKDQRWRSPIGRRLAHTADTSIACNVAAVGEVRRHQRPQAAELIPQRGVDTMVPAVLPVRIRFKTEGAGRVAETEEAGAIGPRALEAEPSVELISTTKALIKSRLERVLVRVIHDTGLVVVLRTTRKIGQRI